MLRSSLRAALLAGEPLMEQFTHKDAGRMWEVIGSKLDVRTTVAVGGVIGAGTAVAKVLEKRVRGQGEKRKGRKPMFGP